MRYTDANLCMHYHILFVRRVIQQQHAEEMEKMREDHEKETTGRKNKSESIISAWACFNPFQCLFTLNEGEFFSLTFIAAQCEH